MAALTWYWHRLRAMSVPEMALHMRKKLREFSDTHRPVDWTRIPVERGEGFPELPPASNTPTVLRDALASDAADILNGRWRPFGRACRLDDPPRWHKDYFADVDLATATSAFKLNHRALRGGADVRVIWELNRWHELVRLAMAAYVCGNQRAAETCIAWLENWAEHNAPFCGWNWTSALESGIRLIQLAWIDALIEGFVETELSNATADRDHGLSIAIELRERMARLRQRLLPPHVFFTWRHRSFGSSANNHLLGELSGLIVAVTRWPSLHQWSASREMLQPLWQEQVLAQFAEDGGNREQALNYHLFAFEFCLHAKLALESSGSRVSESVRERLDGAMHFFWDVQADREPWDYGDSDNAFVTPLCLTRNGVREWRKWMNQDESPALDYWLDAPPLMGRKPDTGAPLCARRLREWWCYEESGIAVSESGFWWLRWDLSPLGYLRTAAHGHLDALHVSVWFKGVALVIDPGTGAYFGDTRLRAWLASRAAHNAPCPAGDEWPRRAGPFLWSEHHDRPRVESSSECVTATLPLRDRKVTREICQSGDGLSWIVKDRCESVSAGEEPFTVRWQFAPATWVQRLGERKFRLNREGVAIELVVSEDWAEVLLFEDAAAESASTLAGTGASLLEQQFGGLVSRTFRRTEWATHLKLVARPRPGSACVFQTTFVASAAT